LELFTNRHDLIRRFLSYLNEETTNSQVLFLYGEGGNGKSFLMEFLQRHCCKSLTGQQWGRLKASSNQEMLSLIRDSAFGRNVPSAYLDFSIPSNRESFTALLSLKRLLGSSGFRFPLYDFANIWHAHKTAGLDGIQLLEMFPPEELELAATLLDVISGTTIGAIGKAVITLFSKHLKLDERYTLYIQRHGLDEQRILEIQRMDPEQELLSELPRLFAEDLNASLASMLDLERAKTGSKETPPAKVVLLFDAHEVFWQHEQGGLSKHLFFQRDEWLRALLGNLNLEGGITAVVAGREKPRWYEATRLAIPEEFIDLQAVGNLSLSDGEHYLKLAGIADPVARQMLLEEAQVGAAEVHPLSLSLVAEVAVASANERNPVAGSRIVDKEHSADKTRELSARVLRYVDAATKKMLAAVSATRMFTRDIYFRLGDALNLDVSEPAFQRLTRFGFVQMLERFGETWYRIQPLQRELLLAEARETVATAHAVMEAYYRGIASAGAKTALAEAVYHANQQDWHRGIVEWTELFEEALSSKQLYLCRALLEVLSDLEIKSDISRADVAVLKADYFSYQALYNEAQQQCHEADLLLDRVLDKDATNLEAHTKRAILHLRMGEMLSRLLRYSEAVVELRRALESFGAALRYAPWDLAVQNNRGIAYLSLAQAQTQLGLYDEAAATYRQAIDIFEHTLSMEPEQRRALAYKANGLKGLGDVHIRRGQYKEALDSFGQAAELLVPGVPGMEDALWVYTSRADVWTGIGIARQQFAMYSEALAAYKQAFADYEHAKAQAPGSLEAQHGVANILMMIGKVHARTGSHRDALQCLRRAIALYDEIISVVPGDTVASMNKTIALTQLGTSQSAAGDQQGAIASYQQAIRSLESAVQSNPDNGQLCLLLAEAHTRLGHAQTVSGDYTGAVHNNEQALRACDRCIALGASPERAGELKARALASLQQLQARAANWAGGWTVEAAGAQSSKLPDFYGNNKQGSESANIESMARQAEALLGKAQLQMAQGQFRDCLDSYKQAINTLATVIELAPRHDRALRLKIVALADMGQVRASLFQMARACDCFREAHADAGKLLEANPADDGLRKLISELEARMRQYCSAG